MKSVMCEESMRIQGIGLDGLARVTVGVATVSVRLFRCSVVQIESGDRTFIALLTDAGVSRSPGAGAVE